MAVINLNSFKPETNQVVFSFIY